MGNDDDVIDMVAGKMAFFFGHEACIDFVDCVTDTCEIGTIDARHVSCFRAGQDFLGAVV